MNAVGDHGEITHLMPPDGGDYEKVLAKFNHAGINVDALAAQPSMSANNLYNLACVCSLCSVAVRRDAQLTKTEQDRRAEQYAVRAIEFLKKAKAAGFFKSVAQVEEMRKNIDLEALRERQDFREWFLKLQPKGQSKKAP